MEFKMPKVKMPKIKKPEFNKDDIKMPKMPQLNFELTEETADKIWTGEIAVGLAVSLIAVIVSLAV